MKENEELKLELGALKKKNGALMEKLEVKEEIEKQYETEIGNLKNRNLKLEKLVNAFTREKSK